jgi:very-short-patch-repair endonuclease
VRLRGPVLEGLDGATARRVRAELREFTELGGFVLAGGWVGAVLDGPAAAQAAFGAVEDLVTRLLPAARAATQRLAAETGLPPAAGLEQWRQRFQLVASVQQTLAVFRPEVFADDLPALLAALAPDAGLFGSAGFFRGRPLRKRAAALWIGRGQPGRGLLREGLTAALAARDAWGSTPVVPAGFDRDRGAFEECYRAVAGLAEVVPGLRLLELDLDRLASTLAALAADERTLRRVPRLNELAAGFDRLGLAPLLGDLRARRPAPETAGDVFEACWLASVLQHVAFVDPQVGTFDGVAHDRLVEEYERLDRRHLDATAARVLRAVAEHVVEVRDAYPDESRLVEHQANLKRRHLPVRQLFAAAPHVLTALKPCWAMSPLVVSQLLPADGQYFDVVVFDEASQVTPADAVPALLRAKQVVVAGDEHQLPPTAFFTAADAAAEEPLGVTADGAIDLALTSGYESILDVLTALLPGYLLRWHYRSQDERLIAFSNAHIYDGSLVTFPGTAGASVLTHVLVDDGEAEADRVVRLILQHAALRPNESLGVIAMGIEHAERIDLALRTALAARPELHPFFAERAAEPFFVKNLERVQGDERDAIILSVGYGRTADGRLLHRFGPLLLEGGERRLNVAITRARRRMTVVSSFAAADLDPARSTAEGVRLLRAFLAYAQSGGNALEQAPPPALNPFEADVRDRLLAAGLPVTPQYGVAGYFIDFAAAHPSLPDEMVLAIETDGFTYHSSTTVRDRDRLRQEQLERLGWRFHRIWSTDWLQDADREVERVCAAYDEAVAAVDAKRSDEPTVVLSYPAPEPAAGEAGPSRDAERPVIEPGRPITGYAPEDLVALVRWIESDTLLRTEDELIEEARRELGFKRGGTRINAALAAAVVSARSAGTAVPDHR